MLNQWVVQSSKTDQMNPLQLAAWHQDATGLIALLEAISDEVFATVVDARNQCGDTAFHIAAARQSLEGFAAFVSKAQCSPQLFSDILLAQFVVPFLQRGTNRLTTPLHLVVEHQPIDNVCLVLQLLTNEALGNAFVIKNDNKKTIEEIAKTLKDQSMLTFLQLVKDYQELVKKSQRDKEAPLDLQEFRARLQQKDKAVEMFEKFLSFRTESELIAKLLTPKEAESELSCESGKSFQKSV